jgi:RecA-family ATPase
MVEGIAMATGRNLLGEQPDRRRRVWLHNGEDPRVELDRRVLAVCQHYGIPQEELTGWFVITSGVDMELKVARGYNELKLDNRLLGEITQRINEFEIEVAIFDPLVKLHDAGEQSNDRMDTIVSAFASIANVCECSIELSHHTRKPPFGTNSDLTVHDARGPSALHAAVRSMRVLNQMSPADAEAFSIEDLDRLRYFRVDQGKSNNARPAATAVWRRFESTLLPNGDDVGVVTEWQAPGQGAQTPEREAANQKADTVFLSLLDKYTTRQENVSHRPGPSYAPSKFAEEREAKLARLSKAALRDAMSRLLEAGRIRAEPYGKPSQERTRLVPARTG